MITPSNGNQCRSCSPAVGRIAITLNVLAGIVTFSGSAWGPLYAQERSTTRSELQVVLELASDFSSARSEAREEVLTLIDQQGRRVDDQYAFVAAVFHGGVDSQYTALAAAQGTDFFDYLRALYRSQARLSGARATDDREWMAKHSRASQQYAGLAADALLTEAKLDEADAARLKKAPFAMRRPAEQQAAFVEKLKRDGLAPEHRKLFLDAGRNEDEIQAFQKQLLQTPPDKIGASAFELLSGIASARRTLAASLHAYAKAAPAALATPSAQTFLVGNPHDRTETIDLFIRRAAVPPSWKVLIDTEMPKDKAKPEQRRVVEVKPGEHYRVTLAAKGKMRIASLVVPIGDVGENTTARWAVEGFIGDESLGGMVHEMHIPANVPDLQLPPIKPATAPPAPSTNASGAATTSTSLAATPAAAKSRWGAVAAIAAGVLLACGIAVWLHRRKRRTAG